MGLADALRIGTNALAAGFLFIFDARRRRRSFMRPPTRFVDWPVVSNVCLKVFIASCTSDWP